MHVARYPQLLFSTTRLSSRSYALSVKPSVAYTRIKGPRIYSEKKNFRYNQYTKLLKTSTTCPLIFLQHTEFSAQRLIKLRRDIVSAYNRSLPSLATPAPHPVQPHPPTLTVVQTAIFGVALRDFPSVATEECAKLSALVRGSLAVLTLPYLDPPQLHMVLRAMDRSVPPKKPKTPEALALELEAKNADPVTPGRRVKRQRPAPIPELRLVGALIENRVFTAEGLREVAALPTLSTIRAQLVGLLSSPAAQLAAVLSEASGGKLARTLEGLKQSLEGAAGAQRT